MALWSGGGYVAAILFFITTSLPVEGSPGYVVCYYSSWAHYRQGLAKYTVEDIPVELCTHLIYAFATLDKNTFLAKPFDSWLDIDLKNYEKFVQLKKKHPKIKVLLGLGGWNDSRSTKYSRLVADDSKRKTFVEEVVKLLLQYGFDGLDLDWEYPGYESRREDKQGFTRWVEDLRTALTPHRLLLTSAVSAGRRNIDRGYDIPKVAKHLDFINLMSYDFHGSWEKVVAHHSPLYPEAGQNPEFCVDFAVNYWIKKGAPAHKLVVGVPLYGRSWTLAGPENFPGSPAIGAGKRGKYVKEKGHMAYFECCLAHQEDGWAKITGDGGPYLTKDDQWVGYDDIDAVTKKAEYARNKGLGGVMVWDTVSDDFNNACGQGSNPLLTAISLTMKGQPLPAALTAKPTPTTTSRPAPTTSSRRGSNQIGRNTKVTGSSTFGSGSAQNNELPYEWLAWPIFSKSPEDTKNSISSSSPPSSFFTSTARPTSFSSSTFSSSFGGSGSAQTTRKPYDWLSWPIFSKSPEDTENTISSSTSSSSFFTSTAPPIHSFSSATTRPSSISGTTKDKGSSSFGSGFAQTTTRKPYQWLSWPIFSKSPEDTENSLSSSTSPSFFTSTAPPIHSFSSATTRPSSISGTTKDKGSSSFGSSFAQTTTRKPYQWLSWPIFNESPEDTKNSVSSFFSPSSSFTTSTARPVSSFSSSSLVSSPNSQSSSSSSSALSWFADCKSFGFAPDPASCGAFYRCTDNYAYRFTCPGGLLWHQDQSACDWPSTVQCVLPLSKPNLEPFKPPENSFF